MTKLTPMLALGGGLSMSHVTGWVTAMIVFGCFVKGVFTIIGTLMERERNPQANWKEGLIIGVVVALAPLIVVGALEAAGISTISNLINFNNLSVDISPN